MRCFKMTNTIDDGDSVAEDALLNVIGQNGKWQIRTFLIASIIGIPSAWNMLAVSFMVPSNIPHWCAPPPTFKAWPEDSWKKYAIPTELEDGILHYKKCSMYNVSYDVAPPLSANVTPAIAQEDLTNSSFIPCQSWPSEEPSVGNVTYQYDNTLLRQTVVEEFQLVCDQEAFVAWAQATYMVGILLGAVIGGMFADKFGRRKSLLFFTVTLLIFGVAVVFSVSIYMFMILRLFVAFSMMALFTTGFVYALETVGGPWRAILGISYEFPFAIGFMSLAGIAWFLKPWVHLELCIILPALLFFSFYFLLPESPRWLLNQGREEEARKIIEDICKTNGRPYSPDMVVQDTGDMNGSEESATIIDLLRTPNLRKRTLNFYYNWFVNSFVYYGLSLNSGNLGGNVFINIFIGGAVEIPAYILSIFVLLKSGRKVALSSSMLVGGVACLCTLFFSKGVYTLDWPIVTFAMIGKFAISASFAIVYVFSAEVFPTVLRTTGVGSSSMCARFGSISAPFIATYGGKAYKHLPVILFGVTSILAGLLALLLPETKGKSLPDTIEQGERFGTDKEELPIRSLKREWTNQPGLRKRGGQHQILR